MGEADAIGSPIIEESKAEERRREREVAGLYSLLRVTCRLQTVCYLVTALITAVITGHYYGPCGQAYGWGLWAVSYGQLAVR